MSVPRDPNSTARSQWTSWAGIGLLVLLCCALAILQYRWIGEVAQAERNRLQEDLQSRLNLLRRGFDDQVSSRLNDLVPSIAALDKLGREQAYLANYRRELESKSPIARRIGLAIPDGDALRLETTDAPGARFVDAAWPVEWSSVHDRLLARINRQPFRFVPPDAAVAEIPHFNPATGEVLEWLIVELNLDTLRNVTIPTVLNRYLASEGRSDYDAEVVTNTDPAQVIYQTGQVGDTADASVPLLDLGYGGRGRGPAPGPEQRPPGDFRMPPPEGRGPPPPDRGRPPAGRGPEPSDRGLWMLRVHHHAGSLEAIVAQGRWRNVVLSGAILLLILTVAASLLRLSRQRQHMAELEMNFVAGVSHELRTPLTVIRTAAYNLRGKLSNQPDQVERYGRLIQEESEKLAALVEDVLRYGSARAGQVIGKREPVAVARIVEESLRRLNENAAEHSGLALEKNIQPNLPWISADEVALRHAVQNLVENAIKHGSTGNGNARHPWVGIFAQAVPSAQGRTVEIRVADRGPGIPADEREHIFDPFFRGRRALSEQIHGTGLGLNLVKKIVEAHGGTIEVKSEPMQGAEFIIRIPVTPEEVQHEFADSLG